MPACGSGSLHRPTGSCAGAAGRARSRSDRLTASAAGLIAMARHWHTTQRLHARLLKGLYLNTALTTAEEHG